MRYRSPAKLTLYAPKPDRPKYWYIYESGTRRRIATGIPEPEYKRAEIELQKYLNELGGQKLRAGSAADRLIATTLLDYLQAREGEVADFDRLKYCAKPLAKYFRGLTVDDITKDICHGYTRARRRKGIGDGTIRRELGLLISALRNDKDNRRIDFVPTVWRPDEPSANERFFTRSEIAQVLNAIRLGTHNFNRRHLRLFVLIAIYLGARKSHILKLKWTDLDLENGWIAWPYTGSKKGTPRRQPIPPNLLWWLRRQQQVATTPYVIEYQGRPIKNVKRSFAGAIERSGINKGRIHDLRHTCASWLYNNGAGLDGVAKWLGHKDPSSTQRYAHANGDFLQDVMSTHRRR